MDLAETATNDAMNWLDWLDGKSQDVVAKPGLPGVPREHVLVPGALSVFVEDHELRLEKNELVPNAEFALPGNGCRSYLTRGLASVGQREIMFVLAPHGEGVTFELEQGVLGVFQPIYKLACDGRTVEFGDMTIFGEHNPFGLSGSGLAYLESTDGPGPSVPKDALLALFLRPEECAAGNVAGVYRAVAWIARAYRLFPYPKFSEPSRATAVPPGLPETVLAKVPLVRAPQEASVFLQDKTLVLRLKVGALDELAMAFAGMEQDSCFGIVTGHVPHANGRVVW